MKAVIYARYSSDTQREASIEDQVRLCNRCIKAEGWKLIDVYSDAAKSGGHDTTRPAYQRMLADAEEHKFDIVVAEALDRLSRNLKHTAALYEDLTFLGIKLFTLAEGEINEMHVGLKGTMNSLYVKELAAKTRRGLEGRVRAGFSGGGILYGYDVVKELNSNGNLIRGKRRVNPVQALVVREIYRWYVEGYGFAEIAAKLNRAGVPSPRGNKWSASGVRPLLKNETFKGVWIWNRTGWRKNPKTGKRVWEEHPRDEWVIVPAPKLRIVSDELWDQVQEKFADRAKALSKRNSEGKRGFGKGPVHLFSGVVVCGKCGSNFIKKDKMRYCCGNFLRTNGSDCDNRITVPEDVLEGKLLHAIKTALFDGTSLKDFKAEVERVIAKRMKSRGRDTDKLQRDLAKTDREIRRIVEAIKVVGVSAALADELRKAEAEKKQLSEALNADALPAIESVEEILQDAMDRYASMALALEDNAARDVTRARNMIKALVGGTIRLIPIKNGGLDAELRGDFGGLIELVRANTKGRPARTIGMVAGEGLEPPTRGL